MSQEKVDKYKQEKYNRKHTTKKTNVKKITSYVAVTLVGVAFLVYILYSVGVTTGILEMPVQTTHIERTPEELQSIRDVLIEKGDPNVQTTTVSPETTKK